MQQARGGLVCGAFFPAEHVSLFDAQELDEIRENDYNLNIPRYVDTFEEEEKIDIRAVQKEIDGLEAELAEVRTRMANYLKELGI